MYTFVFECHNCGRMNYVDADITNPRCRCCSEPYDEDYADDPDPDYGGNFDGHTVHSDAEW